MFQGALRDKRFAAVQALKGFLPSVSSAVCSQVSHRFEFLLAISANEVFCPVVHLPHMRTQTSFGIEAFLAQSAGEVLDLML